MKFLQQLVAFLKSRVFLINLTIALFVVVGGVYAIMAALKDYTRHNVTLTVPDFVGYRTSDLDDVFEENEFRYRIIDSLYDPTREKGVVIDQLPAAETEVKEGRTIYLTINAQLPPMVKVPNLINMSKRQALSVLDIVGLKVKSFEYKPDICTDCVLKQKFEGEEIIPGSLIYKGERLTLVLGEGRGGKRTSIPSLKGLTLEEANNLLQDVSLEMGVSIFEDAKNAEDSAKALVYRQMPEYIVNGRIGMGLSLIHI